MGQLHTPSYGLLAGARAGVDPGGVGGGRVEGVGINALSMCYFAVRICTISHVAYSLITHRDSC